jgi:hypothetical protein
MCRTGAARFIPPAVQEESSASGRNPLAISGVAITGLARVKKGAGRGVAATGAAQG